MKTFIAEFELEKSTKNTYRYKELGKIPMIGSLYIQKYTTDDEPPEHLKVTVEAI